MYKEVKCVPYERVLNLIEAYEELLKYKLGTRSYIEKAHDIQVMQSGLKWFSEREDYNIIIKTRDER